jgi:diguanylate cyclase (GGDEF)-like protein
MAAATLPIVMNIALAALFAMSYVAIAVLHPTQRAAAWFAASYFVGMLTPIGMLGLSYTNLVRPYGTMVFFGFAGGLLLMVPGLAVFYRQRIPWRVIAAITAVTFAAGYALNQIDRNTLQYTMTYQLPFMLAAAASTWMVLKGSPRQGIDLVLAALFALITLHFPVKAVVAAMLGTGPTPAHYIRSTYALLSQVSTAILLVATGLTLLINATLVVLRDSQIAAETDALTGILNRRGFEARAARLLEQARRKAMPAALLLVDIDHFKRVNDTLGHAAGDRAIQALAATLRDVTPQSAVVGRVGGEEFALLLDRAGWEMARHQAEAVREAVLSSREAGMPALTVSVGVTAVGVGDQLLTALEHADAALYEAKRSGRNRVCIFREAPVIVAGQDLAARGGEGG